MNILSLPFFALIAGLFLLYYIVPKRFQWVLLLIASYIFYWFAAPNYVWIMVLTTIETYLAARLLHSCNVKIKTKIKAIEDRAVRKTAKKKVQRRKTIILITALLINFGILFFFKTSYIWHETSILMPLGISFYTFQITGFLIDIYRETTECELNLFKHGLFLSFFPSLIQGPINRHDALGPQLFAPHDLKWKNIKDGVGLFLWGAFKKLVISARAATFVSTVINGDLNHTPGSIVLLAAFMFNLELYTDFSGGIDMVTGVSKLFGIDLAVNFRRPFFARSISEYWRRWHISLGQWLKGYVFYGVAIWIGMSRPMDYLARKCKGPAGQHIAKTLPSGIASIITFLLVGIWHDVTIFYVLYGLWHGGIMALSALFEPVFKRIQAYWDVDTTTLSYRWFERFRTWMLLTFGECLTVTTSMVTLGLIYSRMLFHFEPHALMIHLADYGLDNLDWWVVVLSTLILIFISTKQEAGTRIRESLYRQGRLFQYAAYCGILIVILIFGVYGPGYSAEAFIYGGF